MFETSAPFSWRRRAECRGRSRDVGSTAVDPRCRFPGSRWGGVDFRSGHRGWKCSRVECRCSAVDLRCTAVDDRSTDVGCGSAKSWFSIAKSEFPIDRCASWIDKCRIWIDRCASPIDKSALKIDRTAFRIDPSAFRIDRSGWGSDRSRSSTDRTAFFWSSSPDRRGVVVVCLARAGARASAGGGCLGDGAGRIRPPAPGQWFPPS